MFVEEILGNETLFTLAAVELLDEFKVVLSLDGEQGVLLLDNDVLALVLVVLTIELSCLGYQDCSPRFH